MQLFDSDHRTHHGPAGHVEGTYSFLCRSAWEASGLARGLLEDWFHHYPEAEQPELRRRFESDFDSAFFELAVHELLRRLGAQVEVHPEMHDVSTRPDYLAEFPGTTGVFVEVVVATDEPATEAAEKARQGQLWDEINKVPSPNFFLQISTYEVLTNRQPSGRRIRSFLERELKKFDADQVTDDYELAGDRALPTLRYEDPQVHIDFTLIPKTPVGRKKRSRPIGVYPMESRWGGTTPAIRNAISRKATRYGRLDRPFVVALNCASPWGSETEDVFDALFGTESLVFSEARSRPKVSRNPDGVWYGPDGAQNTRVSAVLYSNLMLWGLHESTFRLFLNPWTTTPLEASPWKVPLAALSDGLVQWRDGVSPADLYELPSNWPGERDSRNAT